ncbi:MAG: hypothetical protein CL927_13575 [Deltaproteobacteria bacterium]|nr:hypothetical protein [Deltaproteobacteria bacterium]HCH65685.1 hypothetical protein [Deltaproteobacteria bacterium]
MLGVVINTIIYLIASITCAALGVQAWDQDRSDPVHRSYFVLALLASITFGSFTLHLLPGFLPLRGLYAIAGVFLPVALLTFIDRFFRPADQPLHAEVGRFWGTTALVAMMYLAVETSLYDGFGQTTPPDIVLALYAMAGFGWCGKRLWGVHQRSEQAVERGRIRLLIGLVGAAVLSTAIEQLVRTIGGDAPVGALTRQARSFALQGAAPPVGAVLGAVSLYSMHYVVRLHRLLDLTEIFARLSALATAALALLLVTSVTMAWSDALADYPLHIAFQMFLASALFLSVYDPLRARLEAWTGEWFNRQGRLLEQTLEEVDAALSRVISLDALGDELLGRLQASGRAPLVSLYLWDHDRRAFVLTLSRGKVTRPLVRAIVGAPFTDGFNAGKRAYPRAALQRSVDRALEDHDQAAARLRVLNTMDADLTVSIHSGELLLGWLNLKAESWTEGFTQDEVRRLISTLDRAAVILENIRSVQALEEQQRLAALGTMAAGLAHEIRNPLAGIKGAAQYLHTSESTPDPEEFADLLGVIVDETNRLAGVVEQFLDYARPMKIHAARVDLIALLDRVLQLVQLNDAARSVDLRLAGSPNITPILCDEGKIHQVMLNLVQNAVEAVGSEGIVTIRLQPGQVTGPGRKPVEAVEILIEDNGPGLSPEALQKLFIPFYTTKNHGTGLGLPISRRLVEAHAGELTARSRPSGGTRVTVRLPAQAPTLLAPPPTGLAKSTTKGDEIPEGL